MSSRGITLLRQPQELVFVPNRGEGYRLRIQAEDAVEMTGAIFLHQQTLIDPSGAEPQDEFVCICSPFDLTIYPENAPALGQFPAFFRKTVADIILPSMKIAADAWNAIFEEVNALVRALDKLDYLSLGSRIRCGEPITSQESYSENLESHSVSLSESRHGEL